MGAASGCFHPHRLAGETEFLMAELRPARFLCQLAKFSERKCAGRGKAGVVLGHRFAKNERGQKINAGRSEPAPSQVGNENESLRKFAATPQYTHRIFVAEMM